MTLVALCAGLGLLLAARPADAASCTADILYCRSCDALGETCELCANDFVLSADGKSCGWPCNTTTLADGSPNPFYVPNALTCSNSDPRNVATCIRGYAANTRTCIRCERKDVTEANNHCSACYWNSPNKCAKCFSGWTDLSNFCQTKADCTNDEGASTGCTLCVEGTLDCLACEENYRLVNGRCVPSILDSESSSYDANCVEAWQVDPFSCFRCAEGYTLDDWAEHCIPCTMGGISGEQHCTACEERSTLQCTACAPGWGNLGNFCTDSADCLTPPMRIQYCEVCSAADRYTCARCAYGYTPSEDGLSCVYGCNVVGSDSYIEGCKDCARVYPNDPIECFFCLPGYTLSDDEQSCLKCENSAAGPVESQHCESCTKDASGQAVASCRTCASGWKDEASFCSVRANCMDAPGIPGCLKCQDESQDPSRCAECRGGFLLSEDGRSCQGMCTMPEHAEYYIANCEKCDSTVSGTCELCVYGYTLSSDRKTCIKCENSDAGSVDQQHCGTCAFSEEDGSLVCTSCETGYYLPEEFCHAYQTCKEGYSAVAGCIACDIVQTAKCVECEKGLYLDEVYNSCVPLCRNKAPENPYYIPHCSQCDEDTHKLCEACDYGYTLYGHEACVSSGECYPPSPNCVSCASDDPASCTECAEGAFEETIGGKKKCSVICAGNKLSMCQRCSAVDEGACAQCQQGFTLDAEGNCVAEACYELVEGALLECRGYGSCDLSGAAPVCVCNGDYRLPDSKCDCRPGYTLIPGGRCVNETKSGKIFPFDDCSAVSNGHCTACIDEFHFGTAMGCKQYWEGCATAGDAACLTCKSGYTLNALNASYNCVPERTCKDEQMPHCAWCENNVCTKCMAGYSGLEDDCETPCDAGAFCLTCDPADPTVCVECERGKPPYCLPMRDCPDGQVLDQKGECVAQKCISADPAYYDWFYPDTVVANLTCHGHGTCVESDGSYTCSCDEGFTVESGCSVCSSRYHKEGDKCVSNGGNFCPIGCLCPMGYCSGCQAGYYLSGQTCSLCKESGCAVCQGSGGGAVCDICLPGFESENKGSKLICKPRCINGCGAGETCVRMQDGSSSCVASGCVRNLHGVDTPCSYNGVCEEGTCKCNAGLADDGQCSTCNAGLLWDEYNYRCVADTQLACPSCGPGQKCANFKGYLMCYPEKCITGFGAATSMCNGAGVCSSLGVCICDDKNKDPESGCTTCKKGYHSYGGNCQRGNCTLGGAYIKYCSKCADDDNTKCAACLHGMAPSLSRTSCVICPDRTRVSSDGTRCECVGMDEALNDENTCALNDCSFLGGCNLCSSSNSMKCGSCKPGYILLADGTCEECPSGRVASADGLRCVCPEGKEPAGDDPDSCIDARCRRIPVRVPGCVACAASDSTLCAVCHQGYVLSDNKKSCNCPEGMELDTEGFCVQPLCKTDDTKIEHCKMCLGADSSLCGDCDNKYLPSWDRKTCGCAMGMETAEDGSCIVPYCKSSQHKVAYCVSCLSSDPYKCKACEAGHVPSADGTKCVCPEGQEEATYGTCIDPMCKKEPYLVPGCFQCNDYQPTRCASCVPPLYFDYRTETCEGCRTGSTPNALGECPCNEDREEDENQNCVCKSGTAQSESLACVVPLCITDKKIEHCSTCSSVDNNLCANCEKNHVLLPDGTGCVCDGDLRETEDGVCKRATCLSLVPGCSVCLSTNPDLCHTCEEGRELSADGSCVCAQGLEYGDDGVTCVSPLCRTGGTAIEYCDLCRAADSTKCARCEKGHSPNSSGTQCVCPESQQETDDGSCGGTECLKLPGCEVCHHLENSACAKCVEGMHPGLYNIICVCNEGTEVAADSEKCVAPTCHTGATSIEYCKRCRTSDPALCGLCELNHVPSTSGAACVCKDGYEEGDTGECIVPLCTRAGGVQDCVLCSAADPTLCVECIDNMHVEGNVCRCNAGLEYGDDERTCVTPLCHTGSTAVEYCDLCSSSDAQRCARCTHNRVPAENNTCVCQAPEEEISGSCRQPTCLEGSTAVPRCIKCGAVQTDCALCEGDREPVDGACPEPIPAKGGLSGGAIAGIVIAVVVILAGVAVGLYFLLRRKTRSDEKLISKDPTPKDMNASM